jgi:hypothetical protein
MKGVRKPSQPERNFHGDMRLAFRPQSDRFRNYSGGVRQEGRP